MSFLPSEFNLEVMTFYLVWVLIAILVIFLFSIIRLNSRIQKLLGGTEAKTIEESLLKMKRDIDALAGFKNESTRYLRTLEERVKRSTQVIETIRFNPFKGTGDGGNQSFSTAAINENGDGVIISSLYSRERVSIFSKPVKNFNSEYELSEEEKNALSQAKEKLALKN